MWVTGVVKRDIVQWDSRLQCPFKQSTSRKFQFGLNNPHILLTCPHSRIQYGDQCFKTSRVIVRIGFFLCVQCECIVHCASRRNAHSDTLLQVSQQNGYVRCAELILRFGLSRFLFPASWKGNVWSHRTFFFFGALAIWELMGFCLDFSARMYQPTDVSLCSADHFYVKLMWGT